MTNLEALGYSVSVPVDNGRLSKILLDRGISLNGEYTGVSTEMELASADLMVKLVTMPNISEGGYSISFSEKESMKKVANAIYAKYGEDSPFEPKIRDSSSRW